MRIPVSHPLCTPSPSPLTSSLTSQAGHPWTCSRQRRLFTPDPGIPFLGVPGQWADDVIVHHVPHRRATATSKDGRGRDTALHVQCAIKTPRDWPVLHASAWLWPGVPGWQCGDLSLGWPAAPCPCVEAGANLQPGMPPRKKRKSATDGMSVAEQLEWGVNFYFRGGDPDRTFENGQLYVPEWLGLAEEDVLVDRVARGLKPVASIVMQPYWDMRQRAAVLHAACKRGLKLAVCHWSRLAVVYVTATPNKTMRELLRERGREGAGLKLKRGVGRKRVGWYVEHGFDMSSGPGIRVDALTSALLLGYPLDLAKQHAGLV